MKLFDVCEINPRQQGISDDTLVSFVGMSDVSEDGKINTSVIRPFSEVKKGYTVFQEGDILFAKITPCMENGKGALAVGLKNGIGVGSTEFHVLRPNPGLVNGMWVYYLTAWSTFRHEAESHMTGSAGQRRVPKSFLEEYSLSVPSLNTQHEQAEHLNRVKRVIEARKEQLCILDQLIKARFVEMFGDRWSNDKGWPISTLEEVADFYNGKPHEQVIDENGEYVLVTSRCIASEGQDVRRTNELLFPLKSGDICMVMSDVPNGKALAKCMYIDCDGRFSLNQRICCFRNYRYNPIFLFYLLNRHEYLLSFNDGDSQTNLRKGDLLACPMIIPPLELQNQFATFVSQVDKSKVKIQMALSEIQLLYNSLLQKYFV